MDDYLVRTLGSQVTCMRGIVMAFASNESGVPRESLRAERRIERWYGSLFACVDDRDDGLSLILEVVIDRRRPCYVVVAVRITYRTQE